MQDKADAVFVARALREFLGIKAKVNAVEIGERNGKTVRAFSVVAPIKEDGEELARVRSFDSVKEAVDFIAPPEADEKLSA